MVEHPAPSLPTDSEEEKDEGLDEKKAQEELRQTLGEEVPELAQGQFLAQVAGALFLLKLKGFQDVKTAFETLKDPKLTDNLFDFEHPESLQQARSAVRIADRELRKKGSAERGRAETKFLFWKQDLTPQQFRRAMFETVVARRVERIVNTEERNIRFKNAVTIYGITDKTQFNTAVQQWLKKNPGRSVDDTYAAVGAQVAGLDRGSAKKKKKKLEEEQKKARSQAIANKKGEIDTGKKIATEFHDGTRETTLRNLSDGLGSIEKGISPAVSQPTPQPTPQPQPVVAPAPVARPIQPPMISKIPAKFTLPRISLPKISFSGLSNFFKPLGSLFSNFGSTLKLGLNKIASKILSKVGSKAIGAAIGQALGSLLPGIGNAAAAILSALGIDEMIMKFALYAALFAVGSIVVIFILIIFGTSSLFSTNTADNPMIIPQTAQSETQIYSWQEFEEKFLSKKNTSD